MVIDLECNGKVIGVDQEDGGLWPMAGGGSLGSDCVDTGSWWGSYETKSEARPRAVFFMVRSHVTLCAGYER